MSVTVAVTGAFSYRLAPEGPSAGQTRLSRWHADNGEGVGRKYASEVARHFAPPAPVAPATTASEPQKTQRTRRTL